MRAKLRTLPKLYSENLFYARLKIWVTASLLDLLVCRLHIAKTLGFRSFLDASQLISFTINLMFAARGRTVPKFSRIAGSQVHDRIKAQIAAITFSLLSTSKATVTSLQNAPLFKRFLSALLRLASGSSTPLKVGIWGATMNEYTLGLRISAR